MPYTDEPPRKKVKKPTVLKVWAVYTNHDEYGRYDEVDDLLGVYEYKTDADRAASRQGWYGGDGSVEERTAIKGQDGKWWLTQMPFSVKLNEKHKDPRKELRKKALGKLSREERAALELEED